MRIGIAFVAMALLPLGLMAQPSGSVSRRPSYLAGTPRNTSFKQQSHATTAYISKKSATSSFAGKKFSVPPFLDKSRVGRNGFRMQTSYSRRTRTTR